MPRLTRGMQAWPIVRTRLTVTACRRAGKCGGSSVSAMPARGPGDSDCRRQTQGFTDHGGAARQRGLRGPSGTHFQTPEPQRGGQEFAEGLGPGAAIVGHDVRDAARVEPRQGTAEVVMAERRQIAGIPGAARAARTPCAWVGTGWPWPWPRAWPSPTAPAVRRPASAAYSPAGCAERPPTPDPGPSRRAASAGCRSATASEPASDVHPPFHSPPCPPRPHHPAARPPLSMPAPRPRNPGSGADPHRFGGRTRPPNCPAPPDRPQPPPHASKKYPCQGPVPGPQQQAPVDRPRRRRRHRGTAASPTGWATDRTWKGEDVVVLDHASSHRGEKGRPARPGRPQQNLPLWYRPAYRPERNDIERLFRKAKHEAVPQRLQPHERALLAAVHACFGGLRDQLSS